MANIDQKLLSLIFSTSRLLKERSFKNIGKTHYTSLHLQTLRYIFEHKIVTMREVANFLFITPPSATTLIEHMAKHGWLKRIADKKDRRSIKIIISTKGKQILKQHCKKVTKILLDRLNKLTAKQKKELIKILETIV